VWLVVRGSVNANSVPIAGGGLGGDPAVTISGVVQGLTTFWTYDDDLTDGVGIDDDYSTQIGTLGAGYFDAGFDGYAVETTNPENEKTVSIYDGAGRLVMSLDGEGKASKMEYDVVVTAATVNTGKPAASAGAPGDLLSVKQLDPLGHAITRYSDAAGRVIMLADAQVPRPRSRRHPTRAYTSAEPPGDRNSCSFPRR